MVIFLFCWIYLFIFWQSYKHHLIWKNQIILLGCLFSTWVHTAIVTSFPNFYYENVCRLRKHWKSSTRNTTSTAWIQLCHFARLALHNSLFMHRSFIHAFQNTLYFTLIFFSVHLLRIRTAVYRTMVPLSALKKLAIISNACQLFLTFPKYFLKNVVKYTWNLPSYFFF